MADLTDVDSSSDREIEFEKMPDFDQFMHKSMQVVDDVFDRPGQVPYPSRDLMSVGALVCSNYNAGKVGTLRKLVEKHCAENVISLSPTGDVLVGREWIVQSWVSSLGAFPDGVLLSKPSQFICGLVFFL